VTLTVGHRHHAELLPHVDELRLLADSILDIDAGQLQERLGRQLRFVDEQLVPHMEMAEANLYPELDRLLEDPRAMAPMRREHAAMLRLLDELRQLHARLSGVPLSVPDELVLRRILYRLFAIMRVHLFEEERYLAIIDRNASEPEVKALVEGMQHAGAVSL
jgi:iron-sulfur cluster repair protein YtfE (RIC family)